MIKASNHPHSSIRGDHISSSRADEATTTVGHCSVTSGRNFVLRTIDAAQQHLRPAPPRKQWSARDGARDKWEEVFSMVLLTATNVALAFGSLLQSP